MWVVWGGGRSLPRALMSVPLLACPSFKSKDSEEDSAPSDASGDTSQGLYGGGFSSG